MAEDAGLKSDSGERKPDLGVVGSAAHSFERALSAPQPVGFVLVLYVAGAAPRSLRAIAQVQRLCQEYLSDCHELQVIDIYQEPAIAERDGIVAVPALIKKHPMPTRTFVGDLSDTDRVLQGLGLSRKAGGGEQR